MFIPFRYCRCFRCKYTIPSFLIPSFLACNSPGYLIFIPHKCLHTHHIFYFLRASRMLRAQSNLKTLTSPAVAASQTPAFNIFKGDLFRAIANIMMQRISSKKIYRGILLKIFFFRCKNLTRLDATNTNISTEVKILFKQKIINADLTHIVIVS